MSVSQAEYEGFVMLLRAMADAGGERITRHLVARDVHDLWLYVRANPSALQVSPA